MTPAKKDGPNGSSAKKKPVNTKKPATKKATTAKRTSRRPRPSEAARKSMGRLERILLLVPYCVKNPGVSLDELAKRFGASRKEIIDDLNLLFMCGLPDYTPADLIEVFVDEDQVFIRMADYFSRPLRLTRTEAIPLYIKGHSLLELLEGSGRGGRALEELAPLRSALEKLGRALLPQEGGVAELAQRIKVHLESGEAQWLPLLREAVTSQKQVELEYYTYSRDAITRRKVDPHLVFASMGHWYTSGYCHLARDRRMFRLDRIKSLDVTDDTFELSEPVEELPPPMVYVPGPDDVAVKIKVVESQAVWLAEYYPVEASKQLSDGRRELTFRTAHFSWLEKLLLRLGTDVEVIDPPELRDRLREGAERILALYDGRTTKR